MKRFSIVVVCLNAGDKLMETLASIAEQDFSDYEIIVKDGNSADGALERLEESLSDGAEGGRKAAGMPSLPAPERVRIFREADQGIYDAMNQAVKRAEGEYLLFLNCGDRFYDSGVLRKTDEAINRCLSMDEKNKSEYIFYGDIYEETTKTLVISNPKLNGFACYRNVPCHQACFYGRGLFQERGYHTKYRVRADYEHFLWCIFEKKAAAVHLPFPVAAYEGGGFSETEQNRKRSALEHREITRLYMTAGELFRYRLILGLTLAPLRSRLARSRTFAGVYNKMKRAIYGGRR